MQARTPYKNNYNTAKPSQGCLETEEDISFQRQQERLARHQNRVEVSKKKPLIKVRSMFFGGIPRNVMVQDLIDYFSDFGVVETVKLDKRRNLNGPFSASFRHRGCGFVQFKDQERRNEALRCEHCIEGESFQCKMALPSTQLKKEEKEIRQNRRKVYISRIPRSLGRKTLLNILIKTAGPVTEVILIRGENNDLHDSAFVIFDRKFVADELAGTQIEIKEGEHYGQKLVVETAKNPNELAFLHKKQPVDKPQNYRINRGRSVLLRNETREVEVGDSSGTVLIDVNMKKVNAALDKFFGRIRSRM